MPKKNGGKVTRRATADDARILLTLFDQRREPLLRKARKFVLFEFSPRNNEEFLNVVSAFGTDEQTYLRMVWGYWDQAAALVNYGAVHEELFNEFANEMYLLYAKYKEFIPALRANFNPKALANVEKVATRTAESRATVERFEKMIAERFKPRAAKTAS
jgi:hypothetical protein